MKTVRRYSWYRKSFAAQMLAHFGLILVVAMSTGVFFTFLLLTYQNDQKKYSDHFYTLDNAIYKMKVEQSNFQLIDARTESFYRESKFPSATAYLDAAEEFKISLEKIELKANKSEAEILINIKDNFKNLKFKMADIFSLKEELGYKDFGTEGMFRDYAHKIEDTIKKDPKMLKLLNIVLEMRRDEKDYMLRGEIKFVSKTLDQANFLQEQVMNFHSGQKEELIDYIKNYKKFLNNYSLLIDKIEKVDQETNSLSLKLELQITQLFNNFKKNSANEIFNIYFIMTLLVVVQFSLLAYWLKQKTKIIIDPLTFLKAHLQEISKGNLDHHFYLSREDEFQSVEEEINKMTLSLKQLNTQNKMAAIGSMSATIAHDVNNPLTTSLMATQKIQRQIIGVGENDLKESLLKSCDTLNRNLIRIGKIINGVRLMARDDSKDPYCKISVKSSLEEAFTYIEEKAQKHGVDVTFENISEDLFIDGKEIAISRVFVNLMSNAIDAIENLQEKWLKISAVDLGVELEISFIDSGPGIPKHIRDQLFKVSVTTKPADVGTGLGLTICGKIIEEHQGTIKVSEDCKNTRFVIVLPKFIEEKLSKSA